jgi:hypothetical protein
MVALRKNDMGRPGCPECALERRAAAVAALPEGVELADDVELPRGIYCPSCSASRARYSEALARFYQGGAGTDLDLSSPSALLATLSRDDVPSELLFWLLMLPQSVQERRYAELEKNYRSSSTTPS